VRIHRQAEQYPWRVAALSPDGRVSVAEQTMERAGHARPTEWPHRVAGLPDDFWGNGGCAAMALAYKNLFPHLKLGTEWDRPPGGSGDHPNHVWAYDDQAGTSHDWRGAHQGRDGAAPRFTHGQIELDVDPARVAASMGHDWSPDEPWADETVARAAEHLVAPSHRTSSRHQGMFDQSQERQANSAGSKPVWYHASPHDFAEGDELIPGGGDSPFANSSYASQPDFAQRGEDHVWLSPTLDDAHEWRNVMGDDYEGDDYRPAHIYEVRPHSVPEDHGEDEGWASVGATIVRKIFDGNTGDVLRQVTAAVNQWNRYGDENRGPISRRIARPGSTGRWPRGIRAAERA
jgi:hypothetical protein